MDLHVVILAGAHERINCPVTKVLDKDYKLNGIVWFKNEENESWYPADAWMTEDNKTEIGMVFQYLHESQELELALDNDGPAWKDIVAEKPPIAVAKKNEKEIEVKINNEPFTFLHVNDGERPYLYPFIGPHGDPITRHFPLMKDIPGETNDHPHHRSIWTAYGDVNEVDHWSSGDMAGVQATKDILVASSGVAAGRIVMDNEWKNKFGDVDLTEQRELWFFNLPRGCQAIDFHITPHRG